MTSIAEQIREFEKALTLPEKENSIVAEMAEHREYVHTEANLPTTVGGVSTNYIFKFQKVHKAKINARLPSVSVRPAKRHGQIEPMAAMAIEEMGKTAQGLVRHFWQRNQMDLKGVMDGAIQDIDTVGIVYLKLDWLEDLKRDPAGAWRPNDHQDTLAKLRALLAKQDAGLLMDDSAEMAELQDLASVVRRQQEGEFWRKVAFTDQDYPGAEDPRKLRWDGLPTSKDLIELPKFRGFALRSIDPEDVRRDWSIKRPEEFRHSRHFTYRTWMSETEIRAFYEIPPDQPLISHGSKRGNDETEADGNVNDQEAVIEGKRRGESYPVWVRMDRLLNKIYHWIEGSDTYLREPEIPEVATTNWFNVFPVFFNRASGRFHPVSNVTLGKPLQDEINLVRTHKRQAKRAAYDRYAVEGDIFDPDDLRKMEECPPNGYFTTSKKVEDLPKKIYRMPGSYNEAVHNVVEERQELGSMLNESQASAGMTRGGSDSATEASIANQTSDAIDQMDMAALDLASYDIAYAMIETLIQAMPEENVKAIVGPGAYWPMIAREQIWTHLELEVEAGSSGMPDQMRRLEAFQKVVEIGQALGVGTIPGGQMWDQLAAMQKLAEIMDWRDAPESLLVPLPPMPMGGPGGPSLPSIGSGSGSTGQPTLPAPDPGVIPPMDQPPAPPAPV